jgi:hypothetical protein
MEVLPNATEQMRSSNCLSKSYHFCSWMNNFHFFQDSCSIIGNGNFTIAILNLKSSQSLFLQ